METFTFLITSKTDCTITETVEANTVEEATAKVEAILKTMNKYYPSQDYKATLQ